jgi:hypothetical protein
VRRTRLTAATAPELSPAPGVLIHMSTRLHLALTAAVLAAIPRAEPAAAQVVTVDEGSFTISQNGREIGREQFRIRRTPTVDGGATYVASATVAYGDHRLSPDLSTDVRGAPLAYRVETRVGTDTQERLTAQVGRGRFSALVKTPKGESLKEYVVADGALILDDEVFHQYYFLAQANRTGSVPVVIPRRNTQVMVRVTAKGTDAVQVGGRTLDARRVELAEPGGATRDSWVDAQGRVLKVSLPARGIVALRDDPPR